MGDTIGRKAWPTPACPAAMPLPLFSLPPLDQKDWIAQRLARPAPAGSARHERRLPAARPRGPRHAGGRAGPAGQPSWRPDDAPDAAQRRPARPPGPDQLSRRPRRARGRVARRTPRCARRPRRWACRRSASRCSANSRRTKPSPVIACTPIVGWVEPPFALTPDPIEVADIFEVPLAFLLDPANQQRHFRMLGEHAPRLLGDPVRRALHLGRDRRDADDPRPHAARRRSSAMTQGDGQTAIVLGGGGARAAYQVGALRAIARILGARAAAPVPGACAAHRQVPSTRLRSR